MEIYKDWKIEKGDYGFYNATNLNDCDAYMIFSKDIREIKLSIDEEIAEKDWIKNNKKI